MPQPIVDLVSQQPGSEMMPMVEQADWNMIVCNTTDVHCPDEQYLLSMALVHRTWTGPASLALRSRVEVMGAGILQACIQSPRMGIWLRGVYFIESLENENADEMIRLLTHLLQSTPNLRKLCIRTWWRLCFPNAADLESVIRDLANKQELDSL